MSGTPRHLVALLAPLLTLSGCEATGPASTSAGPAKTTVDEEVWAIRCITLQTPDRFQQAEAFADALQKVAGLKPSLVQVVSDEDGTAVFYGRYKRVYGTSGPTDQYTPDPLKDLETIRTLRVSAAEIWPFILAAMDLLPTYRSRHPEWDLNDVQDGYWALHVAVFYNTDTLRTRRTAAEEFCAVLREQGEPAYFHHGPTNSYVYVGVYPEPAVATIRKDNPLSGQVTFTRRIVDPQMLAAQERFPHTLHNGHTLVDVQRNPHTGEVTERVPLPSFPVVIPKAERLRQELEGR